MNEIRMRSVDRDMNQPYLAVITKEQTAGYGKKKRPWVTFVGNFFCSILLPVNSRSLTHYPFIIGLALKKAIFNSTHVNAQLKWPNDILINKKKCAGILIEVISHAHQDHEWLNIGVGCNLRHTPELLNYPTTSLFEECQKEIQPHQFLEHFLISAQIYKSAYENKGFNYVRDEWLESAIGLGEGVTVQHAGRENQTVSGTFKTIDHNGRLILSSQGKEIALMTGDVFLNHLS